MGEQIRKDITVVMVAPKCPGTEVREEYKRGFGVPTLIAVHPENDPKGEGMAIAKAWAAATGGHRAGVLESSFVAEVKSDLMGEQTILCGMLQAGSLLCFDKLVEEGTDPAYAEKLIQFGWETITEALKQGGITLMMDRLSNPAKLRAYALSEQLKEIMAPLFQKHMDDIISGEFSSGLNVVCGMLKIMPFTAVLFGGGALALAGMPPFNIFLSEFMTVTAGLARNHLLIIVLLLLLLTLVLAGLVRMAARVLMAKPPQAVNRGDLGWLTTSPMVILLVMMLAMGTHIPQPVIRILAGASTIVLSGTHDLPAQRSTWHDFLPSGTASVSEKHSER